MEKKARFGTGEGHTVLDKDNFAVPERNVLPHSGQGVQLPFQTTPDSPRVIPATDRPTDLPTDRPTDRHALF